jgi:hypothetical protein
VRDQLLPRLAPAAFDRPLLPGLSDYLPLLPVALAIWGTLLLSSGSYRSHRTVPLLDEAWGVVRGLLPGAAILTLTIFALRLGERFVEDQISRSWILLFALVSCLFLLTEKLAIRLTSRYVRSRGLNYRTVLIVGTGPTARRAGPVDRAAPLLGLPPARLVATVVRVGARRGGDRRARRGACRCWGRSTTSPG